MSVAAAAIPSPFQIANLAVGAIGVLDQVGHDIADLFSGCGSICNTASGVANTAEQAFDLVSSNYWATKTPRPKSVQTQALAYIDAIGAWMVKEFSILGGVGAQYIADRVGTGKYSYVTGYRNVIANDPNTYDDQYNAHTLGTTMGPNLVPTTQITIGASGGVIQAGSAPTYSNGPDYSLATVPAPSTSGVSLPIILMIIGGGLLVILLLKREL